MSTCTRSRRRTVLRGAVATAALAGALLAPGAAFAADVPKTGTSAATTAPATDGELVGHPVLADGLKGDLWKKGEGWYYLDLHTDSGMPIAALHVGGPSKQTQDGQQVHGMWVTLDQSGQVHSWNNPATGHGFDAGGAETREGCTVTWHMGTPFEGVSLGLSNSPSGPVAKLIAAKGSQLLATLTSTDRTGLAGGARIKDSDDPRTPTFQMRVTGGQIPWEGVSFPKIPKGCDTEPTAQPTPATKPTPHATASAGKPAPTVSAQTAVVPRGGVAAGADIAQEDTGNTTVLTVGGASTLALGAAGAGFIALRRRSARQN